MSDDYTKLIKEARTIGVVGGSSEDARRVLFALADAVEALTVENEKLRNAENLLAMDALALSQSTTMSLDQAAEFLERIIQQATDHREIGAIRAERDGLRAQLDSMNTEWGYRDIEPGRLTPGNYATPADEVRARSISSRFPTEVEAVRRLVGPWTPVEGEQA
ncbi:hypothetical protein IT072_13815 [Leifsonia sp. ZF2019]|uniref:hypothetical protein n=1 Tax=Leifsonia sp. ZF2019 TaxID=2781978 RepID=UPI001CBACFAF|nr:hypothetical protein [Leifsonia sp. ZF2019]UAJ78335.1 hypothetical protein IT072_13815 [Leifsonia sp. ZF2019]